MEESVEPNDSGVVMISPPNNNEVKRTFLKCLSKKIRLDVYSGLLSRFGDDVFYIISLLAGKSLDFPSSKVLGRIEDSCYCYTEVERELARRKTDAESVSENDMREVYKEVAKSVGIPMYIVKRKHRRIYKILFGNSD